MDVSQCDLSIVNLPPSQDSLNIICSEYSPRFKQDQDTPLRLGGHASSTLTDVDCWTGRTLPHTLSARFQLCIIICQNP